MSFWLVRHVLTAHRHPAGPAGFERQAGSELLRSGLGDASLSPQKPCAGYTQQQKLQPQDRPRKTLQAKKAPAPEAIEQNTRCLKAASPTSSCKPRKLPSVQQGQGPMKHGHRAQHREHITAVQPGLLFWLFKGVSRSVQVLCNGIEAAIILY